MSTHKPTCIFLLEAKICRSRVDFIKSLLNFQSLFCVDNLNSGGGLALMWRDKIEICLLNYLRFHIDAQVRDEKKTLWRLTGLYGNSERAQR